MTDLRQRLGREGERLAEGYLHERGFRTLERRFRNRYGEIDLILEDGETVVFVEVKTRSGSGFGAAEAVSPVKVGRIVRVATAYLAARRWLERYCRFDVVEVISGPDGSRVRHLSDAFRPGETRGRKRR